MLIRHTVGPWQRLPKHGHCARSAHDAAHAQVGGFPCAPLAVDGPLLETHILLLRGVPEVVGEQCGIQDLLHSGQTQGLRQDLGGPQHSTDSSHTCPGGEPRHLYAVAGMECMAHGRWS